MIYILTVLLIFIVILLSVVTFSFKKKVAALRKVNQVLQETLREKNLKKAKFLGAVMALNIKKDSIKYLKQAEAVKYFPPSSMEDVGFDYEEGWYLFNPSDSLVEEIRKLSDFIYLRESPVEKNIYRLA